MNLMWTKNLRTSEEKERFENSLQGSRIVLDRLMELLNEEEEGLNRSEISIDSYSTPNWAEKQAHQNGQRSMLRKIKSIINLDQQKD